MPTSQWRLLRHGPADGPWNMAVDEAISAAVGQGRVPPTLRLYTWRVPTLSLGLLQRLSGAVDLAACARLAIPLVRRPTGGRAVLHAEELTYSVAAPRQGAWRALTVSEAFGLVSRGLILGLERLGIAARAGDTAIGTADRQRVEACFLLPRMPAVLVDGRKLIGSAQRHFPHAVLQHGSVLLDFDAVLHQSIFPGWPRRDPAAGVTSLRALLGTLPPLARLLEAFAAGWEEAVGTACLPGALTAEEEAEAAQLTRERYGTADWTFQR